jgi:peptidoglycan/xylan/chitin deacetylase (PgdA/CDA1 family)
VTPDALERQVTKLLAEGYEGCTFTDDAFASVMELGRPILDRLGVPATVFAVTNFAETGRPLLWDGIDHWKGGPFDGELRSLDWGALRELADTGWEIGSHTCDHPRLTGCSDAELAVQLAGSREAVERGMGRPCRSVAYPYGDTDARVERAAADAGYEAGAALPARWHSPRRLGWPRVGVYHGDDDRRYTIKVSRTVRFLRGVLQR